MSQICGCCLRSNGCCLKSNGCYLILNECCIISSGCCLKSTDTTVIFYRLLIESRIYFCFIYYLQIMFGSLYTTFMLKEFNIKESSNKNHFMYPRTQNNILKCFHFFTLIIHILYSTLCCQMYLSFNSIINCCTS